MFDMNKNINIHTNILSITINRNDIKKINKLLINIGGPFSNIWNIDFELILCLSKIIHKNNDITIYLPNDFLMDKIHICNFLLTYHPITYNLISYDNHDVKYNISFIIIHNHKNINYK